MRSKVPYKLALRLYWKPLLGCCAAWFLYDFVIYPFNLLAPTLVSGFAKHQTLVQKIGYSGLVNGFAIPGSLFGAFLLDRIGRKETYALGWAVVTVFGFAIGGAMLSIRHTFPLFVVLYGIFQAFLSVGPGNCNFLVPSESFPTPLRGHFLGFAAAVGKAGAALGTTALSALLDSYDDTTKGQQVVFLVGSAISLVGTATVWFLIPKASTLKMLSYSQLTSDSITSTWRRRMSDSGLIWRSTAMTLPRWASETYERLTIGDGSRHLGAYTLTTRVGERRLDLLITT